MKFITFLFLIGGGGTSIIFALILPGAFGFLGLIPAAFVGYYGAEMEGILE